MAVPPVNRATSRTVGHFGFTWRRGLGPIGFVWRRRLGPSVLPGGGAGSFGFAWRRGLGPIGFVWRRRLGPSVLPERRWRLQPPHYCASEMRASAPEVELTHRPRARRPTEFCYTCGSESRPPGLSTRHAQPQQSKKIGAWLSLVEHLLREQGVGGSNPLAPTIFFLKILPSQSSGLAYTVSIAEG